MSQRVGVVLAGGHGRRMGRPKGELEIGGKNLAERAAVALWPFCGSVVISFAAGGQNPAPQYHGVEDAAPPGRGPLAGIHAAFTASGDADLLVLACDYPRVDNRLFKRLLELASDDDDLVLVTDPKGRDHPLVSLWRRRTEPQVREALELGHLKVRSLLADFDVRRLGPADFQELDLSRAMLNLNWPSDLEQLQR